MSPCTPTTADNDCPNQPLYISSTTNPWWYVSRLTIAGDGYFYFNYIRENDSSNTHCEETDAADGSIIHKLQSGTTSNSIEYRVLRIASDGTFNDLPIYTYPFGSGYTNSQDRVQTGTDPNTGQPIYGYKYHSDSYYQDTTPYNYGDLITNADQGIYLIWSTVSGGYSGGYSDTDASGHVTSGSTNNPAVFAARITPITGGQVGIDVPLPWLTSDQARGRVDLNLQLQNGDFIAQRDFGRTVMALNATTSDLHWSKSGLGYFAKLQYALADGGMVYRDNGQLVMLDSSGNELSRVADAGTVWSWAAAAYRKGSTESIQPSTSEQNNSLEIVSAETNALTGDATNACPATPATQLEGSYQNLINFLFVACPLCRTAVFEPLNTSQAEFTTYLQQGHRFCDGTKSTAPGGLINAKEATVAEHFKKDTDQTIAATVRNPKQNLTIFFNHNWVSQDDRTNKAMLFHESLHGSSGKGDGGVPGQIGLCDLIGATPDTKIIKIDSTCGTHTVAITNWFLDNIFLQ